MRIFASKEENTYENVVKKSKAIPVTGLGGL
jgi:hypothetical protein